MAVIFRGCYTATSHVICFPLYSFMCGGAVGDRSPRGRLRAVLLHKAGGAAKLPAPRSGLSPQRTAAITLNHPPPLTSANIHWPGKYLVSPSHRERRWPLPRLQTAEILSQLQDYYLVVVAGEHCGSCLPGLPAAGGKMNQRLGGGGKWTALMPTRLCVFTTTSIDTLARIQAAF